MVIDVKIPERGNDATANLVARGPSTGARRQFLRPTKVVPLCGEIISGLERKASSS